MDDRQIDIELFVNLYKDYFGIRPRGEEYRNMQNWPEAKMQREIQTLSKLLDEKMDEDARREATAKVEFDTLLEGMMIDYQISKATALRWEMEASEAWEVDQVLYDYGVSYIHIAEYQAILDGEKV